MADILIKNMELPKDDENLTIVIEADGSVWQKIGSSAYFCTCGEAIELPPHNDLADKSVIIERMGDAQDELWDKVDEKALSECHVAFLKAVMYAPTVLESNE